MPKKSTKSKSKRQTLRHKHKVIRKVKEHHKKKAKEAKKLGRKPKKIKDPGIPSQWPFKQELVKELAWQKQRILAAEQQKKDAKKLAKAEIRAKCTDDDEAMPNALTMEDVKLEAKRKRQAFEAALPQSDQAEKRKDVSTRAFFKDFAHVVEAADVIIEVLDARDPIATRCADVERYVRKAGANKRIVLLLNKIDLVPREVAERWLAYLREELPTVAFKASTQQQSTHLSHRRMPKLAGRKPGRGAGGQRADGSVDGSSKQSNDAVMGSQCLGAETLMQLLKNYARNSGIKTAITVGIVGVPNVGKSSLINSLVRARATQVGNTPGVTRVAQAVHLDKHLTLLDSPGIVFGTRSTVGAALHSFAKVEQVEDPVTAVAEIVRRCPAKQLMLQYRVPSFANTDELLLRIASARGKLRAGGVADSEAAARIVLQDWNNGRIAYYTLPPERGNQLPEDESTLVSAWGKEFDVDAAYGAEGTTVVAGLRPLDDAANGGFFKTSTAGAASIDLEAAAAADDDAEGEDMDETELPIPSTSNTAHDADQTPALYNQPGQFNPHAARAERKRAKKQAENNADGVKQGGAEGPRGLKLAADDDYDFGEAFFNEDPGPSPEDSESEEEARSLDDDDESLEDLTAEA